MRKFVVGLALAAVIGGAGQASAALQTFFGEDLSPGGTVPPGGNAETAQDDFLSNLVGVGTEDFEGFTPGQTPPFVVSFGPDTATLTGPSGTDIQSGPSVGRFPTSGDLYVETNVPPGDGLTVTFSNPQAAFGFYGTDVGDFSGLLVLTLRLLDGGSVSMDVPHSVPASDGSLLYFGVIGDTAADQFTSVTLSNAPGFGTDDYWGFDDMTIGRLEQVGPRIIPEPSTFLVWSLLAGLGVALGWHRRRNK